MLEDWLRALKRFLEALEKRGIKIEKAFVFGSRVRGDWLEDSDIDLVIISEDFKKMKFLERLDLIEKVQWEENISPHIEALPYTKEEFEEKLKRSAVLRDASKYWVEIKLNRNTSER